MRRAWVIMIVLLFTSLQTISQTTVICDLSDILEPTDDVNFEASSNSSIYVIKISSPYPIYIKELTYKVNLTLDANFSGAYQCGFFLTNGIIIKWYGFGADEIFSINRELYYLHVKLGKFNFTYDNRCFSWWSFNGTIGIMKYKNFSLNSGKWYFVFVTVFFRFKGEI